MTPEEAISRLEAALRLLPEASQDRVALEAEKLMQAERRGEMTAAELLERIQPERLLNEEEKGWIAAMKRGGQP